MKGFRRHWPQCKEAAHEEDLVFILVLSWCGLLKAERLEWRLGGAEGVGLQ